MLLVDAASVIDRRVVVDVLLNWVASGGLPNDLDAYLIDHI